MNICITSPRKRMGQTITAINLSAMIAGLIKQDTILIDFNKYCRDIEYYLSDTHITKGLDDFYSLYNSKLLDRRSFPTCVKRLRENMDIMASNGCFEIDDEIIAALLGYTQSLYSVSVIDTASRDNITPAVLFDNSTAVLVVINQAQNIVNQIKNSNLKDYKDRLIFIVNRYSEKIEGVKIRYRLEDIEYDLREAGFDSKIFSLAYDPEIINECNDHTVLNCVLNKPDARRIYTAQMENVAKHVLQLGGLYSIQDEKVSLKGKLHRIFPQINSF